MKFCKDLKTINHLKTQESNALFNILILSAGKVKNGNYKTLDKSFENLRTRINDFKRVPNGIY